MRRTANREGFALAISIIAIVVIGVLIAGAFFGSTQEFRIGRNSLLSQRAFTAAEAGLNVTLANFQGSGWNSRLQTTPSSQTNTLTNSDGSVASVTVTRLNPQLYWITSTGATTVGTGAVSRRTSAIIRTFVPQLAVEAGLVAANGADIGGSSIVNGTEHQPSGWDCNGISTSSVPGVSVPPGEQVRVGNAATVDRIDSTNVAAGSDSTYNNFGPDVDWNRLVAAANVRLPAGTSGFQPTHVGYEDNSVTPATCNTSASRNWGNINRAPAGQPDYGCENYYPIVYAAGDLQVSNGTGQGMLLVEGNLQVTGGFVFYGVIVVQGRLTTQGTGNHMNGVVMANGADLGSTTSVSTRGDAEILFSRCAMTNAMRNIAPMDVLRNRGWADLF